MQSAGPAGTTRSGGMVTWSDDEASARSSAGRVRPGSIYRARYTMPDGTRYSRTVGTKLDAEAWLMHERTLIDQDTWTPPTMRKMAEQRRQAQARYNTVGRYAERYLAGATAAAQHAARLPGAAGRGGSCPYFGEMPLTEVTLSEIKTWRASLPESTLSSNAAAYRLLRSMLVAAEEEELIDRAPPKIRGASTARVQRIAVPATLDELDVITDAMPDHLKLLIVLAAFVGLRQGELLELRRSDVDGVTGRISVSRKVDKEAKPGSRRRMPPVRPPDQLAEDRQRHPHRPRAAAVPADAPESPARALRARSQTACSSPATAPTT